ncbi:MAG: type I-C CRISPR-associated protein Cas8c/Csd1, partial [Candidatus Thermoplasmatota archaeon]|nr:type I-C CRISPR-associated protein Cas8c/Csd1 [Candidatus Thermoplasmatota archaeon]
IRRTRRGYGKLKETIEEIMADLDEAGGFPKTLALADQSRFALGFYHQRAAFRRAWNENNADETTEEAA